MTPDKTKNAPTVPNDMPFEHAMNELESLVRALEAGQLPLAEAISAYERGLLLQQHCARQLQNAQLRIDQIALKADGDGTVRAEATPFRPSSP